MNSRKAQKLDGKKVLDDFRAEAAQLNRCIAAWNLKVPAASFQRKMIDAEREIERIRRGG